MANLKFLVLAIIFEVVGTTLLKFTESFTRILPVCSSIVCYVLSFYFLSICLKSIPIGIAYAIWSGMGIVIITIIGVFIFEQVPDLYGILGILLIIYGVIVLNIFSKTNIH